MPVETADLLLADTETVVTVESVLPKNAPLTVPMRNTFTTVPRTKLQRLADLEIDGAKFSIETQVSRDVAPAVEIKRSLRHHLSGRPDGETSC